MKNKIESIQILRGLAALSVVLFHNRFYLVPEGANSHIPNMLFSWGAIGVDLFFVISGFIMVYVTNDKPAGLKSSANFVVNRLTRILPTYYVLLLFAFLTGGAMSTFHYSEKVANLISAITFHPYLSDPAPLYIGDSSMYNIRWTLNYEIYFYLAFAICLLVKNRLLALGAWFIAPLVAAYIFTSEITFSTNGYAFNSVIARFLTNPIILEFGIGVLAGYAYMFLRDKVKSKTFILSAICFCLIAIGISKNIIGGYNILSACAFFFLVLTFALQSEQIVKYTPRFLVTLGNISFSLYLIHVPFRQFAADKIEKFYPGALHNTLGFVAIIATSILAGYLSHKYLEIRLTNKIRSIISQKLKAAKA